MALSDSHFKPTALPEVADRDLAALIAWLAEKRSRPPVFHPGPIFRKPTTDRWPGDEDNPARRSFSYHVPTLC